MKPKVCVRLMTFDHEMYIAQAMDGIMMQDVNFNIEVVVGDDFSKDETLKIIKSYSDTDKIKIRVLERKIGGDYWIKRQKFGRLYNFIDTLQNCSADYIALLDGDDYWMDRSKLQFQLDLMIENENLSGCGYKENSIIEKQEIHIDQPEIDFYNVHETFNKMHLGHTSSWMFKNYGSEFHSFLNNFNYNLPMGDTPLLFFLLEKGSFGLIDSIATYYRIHSTGLYSMAGKKERIYRSYLVVRYLSNATAIPKELILRRCIRYSNEILELETNLWRKIDFNIRKLYFRILRKWYLLQKRD